MSSLFVILVSTRWSVNIIIRLETDTLFDLATWISWFLGRGSFWRVLQNSLFRSSQVSFLWSFDVVMLCFCGNNYWFWWIKKSITFRVCAALFFSFIFVGFYTLVLLVLICVWVLTKDCLWLVTLSWNFHLNSKFQQTVLGFLQTNSPADYFRFLAFETSLHNQLKSVSLL